MNEETIRRVAAAACQTLIKEYSWDLMDDQKCCCPTCGDDPQIHKQRKYCSQCGSEFQESCTSEDEIADAIKQALDDNDLEIVQKEEEEEDTE